MNKELDKYFKKARQSFKADLPLEQLEDLLSKSPPTSWWATKKLWIMGSSIISIISISILSLFLYNTNTQKKTANANAETNNITIAKNLEQEPSQLVSYNPIKIPIDAAPEQVEQAVEQVLDVAKKATKDTLKPKTSFTEYKVTILKENSKQDVEQLKKELNLYGIAMQLEALEYNDKNEISHFKGRFDTDSLYCGKLSSYDFDIKGPFKEIEFTFRVSNNKNLKYLRIESDNFDKTIECYDDQVLSEVREARAQAEIMHKEALKATKKAKKQLEKAREAQQKAMEKQSLENWLALKNNLKNEVITLMDHANQLGQEAIEIDIDAIKEQIEEALEIYKDGEQEFKDVDIILKKEFKNLKTDIKKALNRSKDALQTWTKDQVHFELCNTATKKDLENLEKNLAAKGVEMNVKKIIYKKGLISNLTLELKIAKNERAILSTDEFGQVKINFNYTKEKGAKNLTVSTSNQACK